MTTAECVKWVDDHGDMLYRFALVRVRDKATAEDLVQETMLAALENAGQYAASSSVATWLTGILKHKIIDHYREMRPDLGSICDSEYLDETGQWRPEAIPGMWNKNTPEDDLENKQLGAVLEAALAAIPPQLAAVFALREIAGLEREEICDLLGLTDSNYWVILHRARLRLRREVELRWMTATPRAVFEPVGHAEGSRKGCCTC